MTSNDKKIILQIKGLRLEAVRGGAVIVDNVDVTLHAGEVLGLIGESGAGKSTIGLSAMAYARAGVHIAGGVLEIDGVISASLTPAAGATCADGALPMWPSLPPPRSTRPIQSWTRCAKRP